MIPPALIVLRIKTNERRLRLWLPLFLLWPLYILTLPIVMLVSVAAAVTTRNMCMLLLMPRLHGLMCCMRGTLIQVQSSEEDIYISIC